MMNSADGSRGSTKRAAFLCEDPSPPEVCSKVPRRTSSSSTSVVTATANAAASAASCGGTTEQVARAMVGQRVMISARTRRLKVKIPSTPLVLQSVMRRGDRLRITLTGHDTRSAQIFYRDWVSLHEDLLQRYYECSDLQDADVLPFCPKDYDDFFCSSVLAAGKRAEDEVYYGHRANKVDVQHLENVMPLFQFKERNLGGEDRSNIRRLVKGVIKGRGGGGSAVADLQCLLVCDCALFHRDTKKAPTQEEEASTGIWRASSVDGQHYDTADEAIRKHVCALLRVIYAREEVMCGLREVPHSLLRVGASPLHPWQAWLYAEFKNMMQRKEEDALLRREEDSAPFTENMLVKRQGGFRGCVHGIASQPRPFRVYVAEPGEGKTRLGCLCAFDVPTLVVAVRGTVRHWQREAGVVGVQAFEVGSGGKTLAQAAAEIAARPLQMWVLTRDALVRLAKKRELYHLPAPKLIVIDEFHLPLTCFQELFHAWPSAVGLGLSGTFHRDKVIAVAQEIGWDADVLEAAVVRVPRGAKKGIFPSVEVHVRRVHMTQLERACYEAGKSWMTKQDRQRLLIFSPPEDRSTSQHYKSELWSTIVRQLQTAENDVHRRLSRLVRHVFSPERKRTLMQQIAEELGSEAALKIEAAASDFPEVVTAFGPGEIRAHLHDAFQLRKQILGSYAFLVRQLDAVSALSEIECPICISEIRSSRTTEWSISTCGHIVCTSCANVETVRDRCPTCRAQPPSWTSAAELARLRSIREDGQQKGGEEEEEDFSVAESLDTSSKLKGLASILLELDASERALVVCPGQLLRAVASEMKRVDISLGIMAGAGVEQERTLTAWSRGELNPSGRRYKGLLCPPTILGVDLPDATTIIFMTTLIPKDDYKQALARVVRQGNVTVERGEKVKVWFLVHRGTEEDESSNLDAKVEMAEMSSGELRSR